MPSQAAPATNSRGRGGKFKKYTRGGGRHFSRDLQPADAEGNKVSMWSADARHSDEDDEESSEEESSDEDAGPAAPAAEASREDRKAQKKAKKLAAIAKSQGRSVEVGDMPSSDEESEDDEMPANPNHSKAARKQTDTNNDVEEITEGVAKINAPGNRKEREALEAQAAKERYLKLQAEGKTDQAKADLARLKLIREQRAAEAERRQAEKEEKDAQDKARKAEIEAREKKLREAAAAAPKKGKKK